MKSEVRFIQGMSFAAVGDTGHGVLMDTKVEVGGGNWAATPKELVLHGLGGCTGMDVVSILRKMRVAFRSFSIVVEAELEADPPKAFRSAHLDYRFEGEGLPLDSLQRAVALSQDKYCAVSHTLRKAFPITWSITVNGQTVARGDSTVKADPA
ncbi:MAG TPA: OsmC family protein [Candidatus Saccharimonadales bacterium]|nr:OsmC family protein [Candidatus Saccharimonadales bacterium]